MNKYLPYFLFSSFLVCLTSTIVAQTDRFAYVITGITKEGSSWNALRKLDLGTGAYSDILLNGIEEKTVVYDALTLKQLNQQPDAKFGTLMHTPFSTGVAAAAYDRKNKRLYYTPMFVDQLRYIDLKTMKVYYLTDQPFTAQGNMHNDEAKCITRMVIAPDGNGYAISNDGNTVVQFTTGKKIKIKQLGTLVDDAANSNMSIHNKCSSFGGDMIADDKGNLFIISARNQVFKVNIESKVATHLGAIKGLTPNFTVNGAVVDGDGNLLVSSAVDGSSYYVVNPKSWEASSFLSSAVYRSSDLANSNYLASANKMTKTIPTLSGRVSPFAHQVQVYPNPITTNNFTLQFSKIPKGDYTVEVMDVRGRSIMQKRIVLNSEITTESFALASTNSKGIYLVKVIDKTKKSFFEQKVMVQ